MLVGLPYANGLAPTSVTSVGREGVERHRQLVLALRTTFGGDLR